VRLLDDLLEPVSELHGARLSPARSEATRARGFLCRLRIANGEYVRKKEYSLLERISSLKKSLKRM
jgi:hypothetical protein